ncbi:Uncharacterized protein PECH_002325 [Penicillium ucsense]|uniref:RRM domain-containing protein n=1 Tax=Penicillium ucsense TaxID=2839758 RepID=A0A8J8VWJ0_9EURO|nr:Uncharacterized protein PECM_001916 [Penicillium ucsense]KAF7731030.1 Uncharacterized protein PECH_002325 [Penicillium ucsense]
MSTRSPRGRSPMRSPDRGLPKLPRSHNRSRSYTRSPTPERYRRSRSRSDSVSRERSLSRSRSRSRSRSPARGGRRYRSASHSRSPSPVQSPPRSSKVVVEKLTKNVTEAHLREIFGSFGDIEHIDLPMNKAFMTNRGTAYIVYYDAADAEAAISHMHEAQLDGVVLNVSIVLPRRNFSRSPPPASNRDMDAGGQEIDGTHIDLHHYLDPDRQCAHGLTLGLDHLHAGEAVGQIVHDRVDAGAPAIAATVTAAGAGAGAAVL